MQKTRMQTLEHIENENWRRLVDSLFSKKGNREVPIKEEMVSILEDRGHEIQEMYRNYRKTNSQKRQETMRYHFPELSDYNDEPKTISDFEPDLTKSICVSLYMSENIDKYYDELRAKIDDLRAYVNDEETKQGQQVYMDLARGRRMKDEKIRSWINEATENMEQELTDYDEEYEAYENRDVSKFGLITNDAVKCLDDFEGRTFPFLRSVIAKVNHGDDVLEVGAGTGVLSIAAAITGAKNVVGIELNPVTCVLADIITADLYRKGLLPKKNTVNIVWSDALKFGAVEYTQYTDTKFDALISENIYTGMFFELQMQMVSRVMDNNLVPVNREIINGFTHRSTTAEVVPEAMSSAVELVDLGDYEPDTPSEVLIDIEDKGYGINKTLTNAYPYDILSYNVEEPSNVFVKLRYTIQQKGTVDAINIYSIVKLSDGDYIGRNENEFLSNDHIVHLNNSIPVKEGDEIILTLAYNEADAVTDGIFEVRKIHKDQIPSEYDARLAISEREHEINKLQYKERNNIKQELDLYNLGDKEQMRCSSFYHDYEHTWRTNLRF